LDTKEKIIVGVNQYIEEDEKIDIPILAISPEVEILQKKRLAELRQGRNQEAVASSLKALQQAAADGSNLMPHLLNATRNYVTLGEMCNSLIEHFGIYEEQAVF
jgi:methylmalonyl-CoA mutase N-terminal domain/subunit